MISTTYVMLVLLLFYTMLFRVMASRCYRHIARDASVVLSALMQQVSQLHKLFCDNFKKANSAEEFLFRIDAIIRYIAHIQRHFVSWSSAR